MVGADAHGSAEFLAELYQRGEVLADAVELFGVLLIRILADGEFFRIGKVTWIDADFFHPLGGFECGVGFEMDIGDERDVTSGSADTIADVFQILRILFGLCGDTCDFTTCLGESENLFDASLCITGVGGDHRLHTDRVITANADVAHHDFASCPARVGEVILTVMEVGVHVDRLKTQEGRVKIC